MLGSIEVIYLDVSVGAQIRLVYGFGWDFVGGLLDTDTKVGC